MNKLIALVVLLTVIFSCEKDDLGTTICKTCTTVVTGPNISTRTSSFTACGDDLKNINQGEINVVISGNICKSRTTCR